MKGVLSFALVVALGCGAPASRLAAGPTEQAIRRGLESGVRTFDHEGWDSLLRRHVDAEGRVDYRAMGAERPALDAYLAGVAAVDLATLSRPEILALLVNAYNACTVRLILDHADAHGGELPASIRDLREPWDRPSCRVGGVTLPLNTVEHGLLRPIFRDPRVHAALNCASVGCPALAPWAYRGPAVTSQLDERMRLMVNTARHVRIEAGVLHLSRIFDWFGADFVDPQSTHRAATVAAYVGAWASEPLRSGLIRLGPAPEVRYIDYDWSLNRR